jgi:signal peptidase I
MQKDLKESELYPAERTKKDSWMSWVSFLLVLAILFCSFLFLRNVWTTCFGGVVVDGSSMNNTFIDGEKLLMRYTSSGAKPKRGDVIVVDARPYQQGGAKEQYVKDGDKVEADFLIKRLIGIEGDVVRWNEDTDSLYIRYAGQDEFVLLDEPYATYKGGVEKYTFGDTTNGNVTDYVVGEGEIFFLGDNRNISMDSRYNEGMSHLDSLYKESDIHGIVPPWAIENREFLTKIFFWREVWAKTDEGKI